MLTAITETLLLSISFSVRLFVVEIQRRWPVGGIFISFLRITVRTLIGLYILAYFINMDYGHIAFDKGVSICKRSAIFWYLSVDFT